MKKIFAILVVFATVSVAVFAGSDDQSKWNNYNTAERSADTELILEDWMLSPSYVSTDLEQELNLENWMINTESNFEKNIDLEEWMLEDSSSTGTDEQHLEIENWMFIIS